jgi:transcription elongation factor Elf1
MEPAIIERRIVCPYCAEPMEVVLDVSAGGQSYIEDCQVCCQPMQISFDVDDNSLQGLQVDRA